VRVPDVILLRVDQLEYSVESLFVALVHAVLDRGADTLPPVFWGVTVVREVVVVRLRERRLIM